MKADLHTHSTASDGQYTPSELVQLAKKRGLEVLALTTTIPWMDWERRFRPGKRRACESSRGLSWLRRNIQPSIFWAIILIRPHQRWPHSAIN